MRNKKLGYIAVSALIMCLVSLALSFNVIAFADNKAGQNASLDKVEGVRSCVLMDSSTGTTIFEQNSTSRHPIASMVKIMTLLRVFQEVNNGNLSLDEDIVVSENAASMGGSQAFLDANGTYKVSELIKSVIVASANDSCVALAERISGSVSAFVETMNTKALELGLNNTHFVNCTGLPAEGQYSCAIDAANMFKEVIKNDKFFEFSKVWYYDIVHPGGRTTRLTNTNKLINSYEGCDGGKTGFTKEAKYCLSATAKRGNTRLICVVMGAETSKDRNAKISEMFNYGFANYESKQLVFKKDYLKDEVCVNNSKIKSVKVRPENDFFMFGKKLDVKDCEIKIISEKISAPKVAGDKVGEIQVIVNGEVKGVVNLVIDENLKELGYLDIVNDIISNW